MKKFFFLFMFMFFTASSVFAQVGNSPIQNLELSVGSNDKVTLLWDLPSGCDNVPMTLSWLKSDTINNCSQAGYDSYMGNLYDTLDLRSLIGWKIESLSYYKTTNWTHTIYVWEQKQGETMRVLYSQEVPDEESLGLNTIQLEEELAIEPNTCYWFALRITYHDGQQGFYPFGTICGEQGFEGKSNLCMVPGINSWQLIPPPCEHFWIRVNMVSPENNKEFMRNGEESQSLSGYRIYRDGTLIKEIPYGFVTYFTDTEFTRETDVEYCVTAVYGDEESEPVCATATITDIESVNEKDGITLSPNPTSGIVRIEGAPVAEIQVYNALGQLVKTARNTNEISLKGQSGGIYLVTVTDKSGRKSVRMLVKE